MIGLVERLRFDAVRCEVAYSKGVAGNIEEAANEIERLRAALEDISNPIAAIQARAKRDGMLVNGSMAVMLCDDPHYLRGIAKKALEIPA